MSSQTFSSSSTSEPGWNHDVFLSFRGEDTRKNFTDHLYTALVQAGIHTFRDDDELARGKEISTELLKAIQESRISIVVHTVLPIFYDVNPSDVRKQNGTFAGAFTRHEERFTAEMEKVQKWRAALTEAANLSGWDLQSLANGCESRFIEKIVEDVLNKVNYTPLNVAIHPIGIAARVEKMKALLNLGKPDVSIVGIYGMGGIGKTTLAKAIYNQICDGFEGSCFLLNIKEISEQPNGLVDLQEQLLFDILKLKNFKIGNVDRGINLIKERFRRKRVLVVLDDVDDLKQVHSLVGNSDWFGSGSRVIVTTRDEHLLTRLGVYGKYKVEELNFEESFQLFSWHAFGMAHPIEDYLELSNCVVKYVLGLPLALEVLGSFLLGRSIIEWKSELEKLHKIPPHQIQKILRISFDSLDDDTVKNIFLDIACFFIGMDKGYACRILNGCGFFPDIGISILIQRSLVTINNENELRMHDMIRDMGREIVREKSPCNDPGKRSRLWFHEDVLNVLNKHMGSEAVEGLILNSHVLDYVHLKTEAFVNMKNLRLLQINGVHLTGCFEHLSKELRTILKVLVVMFLIVDITKKLKCHNFATSFLFWFMLFEKSKSEVTTISVKVGFTLILGVYPSLQELDLSRTNFHNLPHGIGRLPKLRSLMLNDCTSLQSISELPPSLVYLEADGCTSMERLSILSNMKSSRKFYLGNCHRLVEIQGLENLPSSPTFYMERCNNMANDFKKILLQCLFERDELHAIVLLVSEVPNWFNHKRIGSSISFRVPTHSKGEIQGLIVWVVFAAKREPRNGYSYPSVIIKNKTRDWTETCSSQFVGVLKIYEDHSVVCRFPLKINKFGMESGDEIEVSIITDTFEVKKCGIHLLVNEPDVLVEYESMVQQVDSETASAGNGTMVRAKRGRDDKEAGPSNDWPNEEKLPKQSKMESEAQE
uniref:TIR domain-containing protein n=1 Tax=Fagus sylvatica TaxID=28930 RepID=A0A2N9HHX6_FAGSY